MMRTPPTDDDTRAGVDVRAPLKAEARSLAASVVDCAVYVDGARLPGARSPEEAVAEVRRLGVGFV
ncbi:MAG: magnesium transporter, partial [Actinomycetota bacterium]|nr:magnesium transporter [Actinomycetota bacterium]